MTNGYWQSAEADEAMQDEHGFLWRAMLDTVDADLAGARVLDAGCNQGGFLRLLVDAAGIGQGFGYDPASGAVDDARRLAGDRPLTFEAGSTVPDGWSGFDAAFSHEVLYLVHDLAAHAAALHHALAPGASYYAVCGMHTGAPLMAAWHKANADRLAMPPLRSLDEMMRTFEAAGFTAAAARLRLRFVPVDAHRGDGEARDDLADCLAYYHEQKLLLRFTRPA